MKKTIILYYSKTKNNKFIAKKLSKQLDSNLEEIIPTTKIFFLLLLFTLFKMGANIKPLSLNITNYKRVILLGPIWMGNLVSPIRGFIKQYKKDIKELIFITVCGSGIEDSESNFGYNKVFKQIKKIFQDKNISCYEISTKSLSSKTSSNEPIISEELFTGKIKKRFEEIVEILKQ